MRKGLFRTEVVNRPTSNSHGNILLSPSPLYSLLTGMFVVWLAAAIIYISVGQYPRKTSVQGWLEPKTGMFKLFSHSQRGEVTAVHVENGAKVSKGDPLVTISYRDKDTNGSANTFVFEELKATEARTMQSLMRLRELHTLERMQLSSERSNAKSVLEELDTLVQLAQQQWSLANRRLNQQTRLKKAGFVSQQNIDDEDFRVLSLTHQLKLAEQEREKARLHLKSLSQKVSSFPQRHANELSDIENKLSDIRRRIIIQKNAEEKTIYASHGGVVSGLNVKVGYIVDGKRPLLTVLPQNAAMLARIVIPVSNAGFIDVGQSLRIRYDAFPYQKFGTHLGEVVSVSPTMMLPGELVDAPILIQEPSYVVTAQLNTNEISAYGKALTLKAGMTFSADVLLSQRTLIEWLLEPLYSIRGKL